MKILYGVQATGQGHISRARAMSVALAKYGVDVTWLFSGRERERLFDMEPFPDYQHRRGLTFTTDKGQVKYLQTVFDNHIPRFLGDVREIDLTPYDLIVTDFEPITAWAGKLRGKPTVGIGHQYALQGNAPRAEGNILGQLVVKIFAPVKQPLGLHWYPFDPTTLPPILDLGHGEDRPGDHILVYLPFEDQTAVTALLQGIKDYQFVQYAPGLQKGQRENVQLHPTSIITFKQHLHTAAGVICNSGFELISECLQLGKPTLTKPLSGQVEQLHNAMVLERLGYATSFTKLAENPLRDWLKVRPAPPPIEYPDVAAALAAWLASGCKKTPAELSSQLWQHQDNVTAAYTF